MDASESIQAQLGESGSILVIDDSLSIRTIIKSMFVKSGISQLAEAEDGQMGWEYLEAHASEVKVVICDWDMPRLSGIELLEKVRGDQRFCELPFLMVTTKSEAECKEEAMGKGASQYITKPFSPTLLIGEVCKVLEDMKI